MIHAVRLNGCMSEVAERRRKLRGNSGPAGIILSKAGFVIDGNRLVGRPVVFILNGTFNWNSAGIHGSLDESRTPYQGRGCRDPILKE